MDLAKLTAAIEPLAKTFASELAGVVHKHFSARIDAARKAAVEQLRTDLEEVDANVRPDRKPARRQLPRGAAKGRPRRRRAARRDHRNGAPAPTPRATQAPTHKEVTDV